MEENNQQLNQQNYQYNQKYNQTQYSQPQLNIPLEYKPISAWGYFGYTILFNIPILGIIMLLVFSLGGTQNINLKNYARSYFCILLVAFIILMIVLMTGVCASIFNSADKTIMGSGI